MELLEKFHGEDWNYELTGDNGIESEYMRVHGIVIGWSQKDLLFAGKASEVWKKWDRLIGGEEGNLVKHY